MCGNRLRSLNTRSAASHIGDRESDIYELFCAAQEMGTHFLVRTCVDRLAGDGSGTILGEMKQVQVQGLHRIEVRNKQGRISHAVLEPLLEALLRYVMAAGKLHADGTPVPVLAPGNGKTKTGRLHACGFFGCISADPAFRNGSSRGGSGGTSLCQQLAIFKGKQKRARDWPRAIAGSGVQYQWYGKPSDGPYCWFIPTRW